jgi:glycosyltransferase involved in cell wall biosynthesis
MANLQKHLKVLHIASGDLWAGAEVQLYTLVKALSNEADVEVAVVLLNHGKLEQKLIDTGIEVTVIDESKLNGLRIFLQLVIAIRRQRPDIVHTHRIKENILGSLAALICGNKPSLRTVHGAPEHKHAWYQLHKIIIRSLDIFSAWFIQRNIIAVSDDLAEILKQWYPAIKLRVIENGIDTAEISKLVSSTREAHHTAPDIIKVGIAGRLVPVKRVDLFIETAKYLQEHYPELHAKFFIYGDGPLRHSLEALSRNLGTNNIVKFEGHTDDMANKLQELDALLMTSDHEGLPMVLLEAMASKTLIISHAVGGIPKLLEYGECGILIKDHKASTYAHALVKLLDCSETIRAITDNAYARVADEYSATTNASKYRKLYNQILIHASQSH